MVIPHMLGLSDKKKQESTIAFTTQNTLKQSVVKTIQKIGTQQSKNYVYNFKCSCNRKYKRDKTTTKC